MGGAVAERRLRPLWDAIESRQYKSALKLATALLGKHPDAPYIVVLKALVLERLGKPDEALVSCRQAKDMQPTDDMTLKALELVYHRLGRLEESTLCFEKACALEPGNVDLLISLFGCHVRQYNYVKQQQVAMKIYKLTGDEKYLFWAVCSIYLQVRPGNAAEKQLLALAEALLKKRIDATGLRDLEGLRLYISLFLAQNRFEDALALVVGETGALFNMPVERLKLQADLLMQLRRFPEAAAIYRVILGISSDDWNATMRFINASLEVSGDASTTKTAEDKLSQQLSSMSLSANETIDRLEKIAEILRSYQRSDTSEIIRGPYLAMVEIEHRRPQYGFRDSEDTPSMPLASSILDYFKRFGHLAGFFSDVKSYLSALDPQSQEWLVNKSTEALSEFAGLTGPGQLRNEISVCQIEEFTGRLRGGDSLGAVKRLVNLYRDNLSYSVDLDPAENIIGEELLVIAANQLVKLFLQTRHFSYFLEAAAVLEFGLSLRRFNSHFKVMLVSLYSSIFAVSYAVQWFRTLEVKNILLESASHHILPLLLAAQYSPALGVLLADTIRFHEDSQHEVADMTITTYRNGNYSKIVEFLELKDRLANSHHYLRVRIEMAILSLAYKAEDLDAVEAILMKMENGNNILELASESRLAALIFNEDLETRPWWTPVPDTNLLTGSSSMQAQEIEAVSSAAAKAQVAAADQERWRGSVRRRSLIPRLLFLTLNALSFEKDRDERCQELKQHLDLYAESLSIKLDDLKADGIGIGVDDKHLILLLMLALDLASWSSPSEDRIVRSMAILGETLTRSVATLLQSCEEGILGFGAAMPALTKLVSEPVLWLGLSVQAWSKRLQPSGKKKRRGSSDEKNASKIMDALRSLAASTSSAIEAVASWSTRRSQTPQGEVSGLLAMARSGIVEMVELPCVIAPASPWKADDLAAKIVASQREAVAGLEELCKSRLRILKDFK